MGWLQQWNLLAAVLLCLPSLSTAQGKNGHVIFQGVTNEYVQQIFQLTLALSFHSEIHKYIVYIYIVTMTIFKQSAYFFFVMNLHIL